MDNLIIRPLQDFDSLKRFSCGEPSMDSFIQKKLWKSIAFGYCKGYGCFSEQDKLIAKTQC